MNDVRSTDGQGGRLVDLQRLPVNAVVCEYVLAARLGSRPQRVLAKQVELGTAAASRLAKAAAQMDVDAGSASAQCPSDSGSVTVIAFGYRDAAPADLWWLSTGCQTIDNGTTEAQQVANDSFGDFQTVFAKTTRRGA